jgi:hypothetical protein
MLKEYAVYKGEELLAIGTIEECAKMLNVKPKTVYFYTTNTYKRRLEMRKNPDNCRIAISLDD